MEGKRRGRDSYLNSNRGPRRGSYHRGSTYRGRYKYYAGRPYENNRIVTRNFTKYDKRVPSRSASPVEGSEEYMTRKIQQTSAIIMRQLLSPDESITSITQSNKNVTDTGGAEPHRSDNIKENAHQPSDKLIDKSVNKNKKACETNLSAKEIHEKIMNHITNLNNGRKKNFINANSSTGLDDAISHMQKQKRLEISRILRDMNSESGNQESEENTNSIVPDIGIKIEELPENVIEELRQTLNLDLEYLNEVIAGSDNLDNRELRVIVSSGELAEAVASIEVKREQLDPIDNNDCVDSVEIKAEDISDVFEERAEDLPTCLPEQMNSESLPEVDQVSTNQTLCIKEEADQSIFSDTSTIFVQNNVENQNEVPDHANCRKTNNLESTCFLRNTEEALRQFTERERSFECTDVDSALQNIDLVELCERYLANYKRSLTQKIVTSLRRTNSSNRKDEEIRHASQISKPETLVTLPSQPISCGISCDEEGNLKKKRKISNTQEGNIRPNYPQPQQEEIKSETDDMLEIVPHLNLPKIQDKIVAIERVDNELALATDSGNIICVNLSDDSVQYRLDVTSCSITSVSFVRGISDFIYMYVGSLEEVLRIYDYRKRKILNVSRIEDQVRCMDSKWDYVFLGCKNGTLIRYSCNKGKIETEHKHTGTDILVLKTAHEGPRRVLLVGHRQAPIYVRDAMSGQYLRNFSNQAVAPTVYSIVIDQSKLYCGTAKHNILVFSFNDGELKEKIIADESKGISCMKIFKNLLFAGCYNGSIYVYDLKATNKRVATFKGPGGGIMCMEVLSNQVVVGTLTGQLDSVSLPSDLFSDV